MSHDDRENYNQWLLSTRECHYCHRVGHLKRSCRKYLKKIKEKQFQLEKRKEDLDRTWKKLFTKSLDDAKHTIMSLQQDVLNLKNQIKKQNTFIDQQNDRLKSQPYIHPNFFIELFHSTHQELLNKIAKFHNADSSQESSSSSEEEIVMFPSRFISISTSKKKDKLILKKTVKQNKDPSSKRKGKQNKTKNQS